MWSRMVQWVMGDLSVGISGGLWWLSLGDGLVGCGRRELGNGFGEAWFWLWREGFVEDGSGSFGSEGRSKVRLLLEKEMGVMGFSMVVFNGACLCGSVKWRWLAMGVGLVRLAASVVIKYDKLAKMNEEDGRRFV
ncbi:hypothetical protein V6N11_051907 [Hibiscus sabdariffa]|uniref:Transmembrane protein n=1 Tax=Hibiscus sabdariffa TaxID=183260 RepID=A0ABR2U8R2_9ROSI